jgi:ubiquinone/menaquinone biosynthesis C-methylase UbiE
MIDRVVTLLEMGTMQFVEVGGIQYEVLPWKQRIARIVIDPWRNFLLPASFWRYVMRRCQSPLIAELMRCPGGWQSMRIVYSNEAPAGMFDREAVRYNPISMAARNRRKLVISMLTEMIDRRADSGRLDVVGVGAGPGLHVQEAICQSKINPANVHAYLIDCDSDAFEYGRSCAADRGIQQCVSFVQGDARAIRSVLPEVSPQIVKIVGLLEYLTDHQALDLLRALHEVMATDGQILTHGIVDRYRSARFMRRTFGLNLIYRTGSHVQHMLESVGFRVVSTCEEPLRIYPILVAAR